MTAFQEVWETETLAALFIHKLREQGYELSESGKARIKEKLLASGLEAFSIVLEDEDIAASKCANLQTSQISLEFTDDDIDSIGDIASDVTHDFIESSSETMLNRIKQDAPSMLKEQRQNRRQFEKRLRKRWKRPLDLLDLFISVATEAGSDFNDEFRDDAARSDDAVFEALTRLHARACQVSSEILTLLRSGYADGAHARWRTLHEIAVVSHLINEHGQDLAERYLLHNNIQVYKAARQYRKYSERINYEPMSEEEFEDIKSEHDNLVRRFGKDYKKPYGWAASAIGIKSPSFDQIERHIGLDHMRPYYGMASDNVHANSHGALFRIGLGLESDIVLAGASDMGLADPGHATAISLCQTTVSLLATRSTASYLVVSRILMKLQNEIGRAFLEVHQKLEPSDEVDSRNGG